MDELLEAVKRTGLYSAVNVRPEPEGHNWVRGMHSGDPEVDKIVWCAWCGQHRIEVPDWVDNPACDALDAMKAALRVRDI